MEIDSDKVIENAIRDGLRDGVKNRFASGYSNPLDKVIESAVAKHTAEMRTMLEESIASCIGDELFRSEIAQAVRHSLAKTLIARFGGEMEKQVNVLKRDPTTRARITLAIEEIVKSQKN